MGEKKTGHFALRQTPRNKKIQKKSFFFIKGGARQKAFKRIQEYGCRIPDNIQY
jgi:hypothetical protein